MAPPGPAHHQTRRPAVQRRPSTRYPRPCSVLRPAGGVLMGCVRDARRRFVPVQRCVCSAHNASPSRQVEQKSLNKTNKREAMRFRSAINATSGGRKIMEMPKCSRQMATNVIRSQARASARCCRAQIKHFFGMHIGSQTPYGLDLMVDRRLHRMRRCLWLLESSEDDSWTTSARRMGLEMHLRRCI